MIILNFSHPITDEPRARITKLTGAPIDEALYSSRADRPSAGARETNTNHR